MTYKKSLIFMLALCLLLSLCGCSGSSESGAPAEEPPEEAGQLQYEYQLKAGETLEVRDTVFEEPVTVTVDPASTRDGPIDLRSGISFENCVFNSGLILVGDYHAMVSLGAGCSFAEGSAVTFGEATEGAAQAITLEDNLVKLLVSCQGVTVETDSALGVLSDGEDFTLNGTVYSKTELAPHTDFLGVYSIYEGGELNYIKLAIGEDDSVEFLN